ncbi:MAG: hypothetical protein U0003_03585 [Vampirovibrionales bacterium]
MAWQNVAAIFQGSRWLVLLMIGLMAIQAYGWHWGVPSVLMARYWESYAWACAWLENPTVLALAQTSTAAWILVGIKGVMSALAPLLWIKITAAVWMGILGNGLWLWAFTACLKRWQWPQQMAGIAGACLVLNPVFAQNTLTGVAWQGLFWVLAIAILPVHLQSVSSQWRSQTQKPFSVKNKRIGQEASFFMPLFKASMGWLVLFIIAYFTVGLGGTILGVLLYLSVCTFLQQASHVSYLYMIKRIQPLMVAAFLGLVLLIILNGFATLKGGNIFQQRDFRELGEIRHFGRWLFKMDSGTFFSMLLMLAGLFGGNKNNKNPTVSFMKAIQQSPTTRFKNNQPIHVSARSLCWLFVGSVITQQWALMAMVASLTLGQMLLAVDSKKILRGEALRRWDALLMGLIISLLTIAVLLFYACPDVLPWFHDSSGRLASQSVVVWMLGSWVWPLAWWKLTVIVSILFLMMVGFLLLLRGPHWVQQKAMNTFFACCLTVVTLLQIGLLAWASPQWQGHSSMEMPFSKAIHMPFSRLTQAVSYRHLDWLTTTVWPSAKSSTLSSENHPLVGQLHILPEEDYYQKNSLSNRQACWLLGTLTTPHVIGVPLLNYQWLSSRRWVWVVSPPKAAVSQCLLH